MDTIHRLGRFVLAGLLAAVAGLAAAEPAHATQRDPAGDRATMLDAREPTIHPARVTGQVVVRSGRAAKVL
jgi:hypothetical protein